MFRGLIDDAKSAVSSVILKYVARASVAVPFLIAIGFGIAALTVFLVDRFGALYAYLMIAGGFVVIGLIAALAVTVKEHEEAVADAEAEKQDTKEVGTDAAAQAAVQLPIAILGALASTPVGPAASLKALRALGRNLPLVALLVLIGMLFWPRSPQEEVVAEETERPRPNGAHPPYPEPEART